MWGIKLLGIVLLSGILVLATRIVVEAFKRLVAQAGWQKLTVASLLVALVTSLPELFVGVAAALEGTPVVGLGNVIGSNIVNLSLVMGGAALIAGGVAVVGDFLKRELVVAFLAGVAPIVLLLDGSLSRVEGLVLLLFYAFYVRDTLLNGGSRGGFKRGRHHYSFLRRVKVWHKHRVDSWGLKLVAGLVIILLAADGIVKLSVSLAQDLHLPVILISLFLIAMGTSLPELALEFGSVRKKEVALVFGNILGSTVANSTLVIGVTAVMAPIEIIALPRYLTAAGFFLAVFGLFWLFTSTKRKLERWEGLVLIGVYLMFMGLEFLLG